MDVLSIFVGLGLLVLLVHGKRDEELYCTVCRIIVDELSYDISKVSPDKKAQVGSFRIDPQGNNGRYSVPYARSDVHLTELLEQVCGKMTNYAEMTTDGQTNIVRTAARDGKYILYNKVDVKPELQKKLKYYCENLLEEHEEDIIELLKKESIPDTNLESIVCGEISGLCSEPQLSVVLATGLAEVDTPPPEEAEEAEEAEEQPEDDTAATDDVDADDVDAGDVDAGKKESEADDDKEQTVVKEDL